MGKRKATSSKIGKKYEEKLLEQIPKKTTTTKKTPRKANKIFAKHLAGAPMGSINAYWHNYCAPCNLNSTKTTIFSKRLFDCFCNNVFIPNETNL